MEWKAWVRQEEAGAEGLMSCRAGLGWQGEGLLEQERGDGAGGNADPAGLPRHAGTHEGGSDGAVGRETGGRQTWLQERLGLGHVD